MTTREEILEQAIKDAGKDFANVYRKEYGVELTPIEATVVSLGLIRIFYNNPSIEPSTKAILTVASEEINRIIDSFIN